MDEEYDNYYFDDAVGGSEGGYSGNQSNYDSDFSDWEYNPESGGTGGDYNYVGGNQGNGNNFSDWYQPQEPNTTPIGDDQGVFGGAGYRQNENADLMPPQNDFGGSGIKFLPDRPEGPLWGADQGSLGNPMANGSMGGVGGGNDYTAANNHGNATADWGSLLKNLAGFSTSGTAIGGGSGSSGSAGGQTSSMLQSLLKGNGNGALGSLAGIGGVQALMKLYQASQEKKKNAQYEQDAQKSLEGQRAYLDPYAQQRAYMNQRQMEAGDRLNNLYSNPTGNPLYQSSLAEMQRRVPRQFSRNRFSMGANRAMSQQAPELLAKAMENERANIKSFGTNWVPNGANEAVNAYLAAQKNNLTNPQNQAINDILQTMKQDGGQNDILNTLLGRG